MAELNKKKPYCTKRIVEFLEANNGSVQREDMRKKLKNEGYSSEAIRQGLDSLEARKIISREGDAKARNQILYLLNQ